MCSRKSSRTSERSSTGPISGVATTPGATAFTRTPTGPSSSAATDGAERGGREGEGRLEPGLGREVVGQAGDRPGAVDRRDRDERAPAAGGELAGNGAQDVPGAGQVHVEDEIPLLRLDLEKRR